MNILPQKHESQQVLPKVPPWIFYLNLWFYRVQNPLQCKFCSSSLPSVLLRGIRTFRLGLDAALATLSRLVYSYQ